MTRSSPHETTQTPDKAGSHTFIMVVAIAAAVVALRRTTEE
jgi:hypothetical protein